MNKRTIKIIVAIVLAVVIGISLSLFAFNVKPQDEEQPYTNIEYSEKEVSALVSTSFSKAKVVHLPTMMGIDSSSIPNEDGAYEAIANSYYPQVRIESPFAFQADTLGRCLDSDGSWGSQCYDIANIYWQNYVRRPLSTCGTGAAKGTLNCWEYNAGNEFDMVWDATQIQPGDWVVFGSGEFGHIGMAMGYYNSGFVTLLGQNQGGSPCDGGGSSTNLINISLRDFKGAFRPKIYVQPPAPQPVSPNTGIPE